MYTLHFRPADPETDFGRLAAWFTDLEGELNSEAGLKEYYHKQKARITQRVAEDGQGELAGFYWVVRDRSLLDRFSISLFVKPELRRQGVGSLQYEELLRSIEDLPVKTLQVNIWDNCPECRAFAERRGFCEKSYRIGMALDLDAFDDHSCADIVARLQCEGFQFTTMEELGDTEEAQRKLFALNDGTSITDPGSDGEHSWSSFDDFQQRVCQSEWYKPGGQFVAIDTASGAWAGMSAITRFEGADYAYNPFTGVDMPYRGRKLGQAVKALALRYARDVLQVHEVRTHHMVQNLPMIAIDRKFGYVQTPGTYLMEKVL